MEETLVPDWIPIFPLENVVLFPKVRVPLHIFEPRYREMTHAALSDHKRIGMVTTLPEHLQGNSDAPPIFKVGCEGLISSHELLPDGRYNIVLMGLSRFNILEEQAPSQERAYRTARIERLDEIPASGALENDEIQLQRGEVLERLTEWVRRTSDSPEQAISEELLQPFDDETFVNMLAQSIDFAAAERQALLECDAISQRMRDLNGLLRFRLSELASHIAGSSPLH